MRGGADIEQILSQERAAFDSFIGQVKIEELPPLGDQREVAPAACSGRLSQRAGGSLDRRARDPGKATMWHRQDRQR
jgi:hypothetical protein